MTGGENAASVVAGAVTRFMTERGRHLYLETGVWKLELFGAAIENAQSSRRLSARQERFLIKN